MKDVKKNILYLVIPCYNEEEVLPITTKKLTEKLDNMIKGKLVSKESRIMYVNDGSKDRTWELIGQFNKTNKYVTGVNLSRNRGHQNALLAGLMTAKEYADIVVSMDADLKDDIDGVDKIVVLKEGVVAEQGKPQELKQQKGIYKHMVDMQMQSNSWKYQ